jgi:hypothetical protein
MDDLSYDIVERICDNMDLCDFNSFIRTSKKNYELKNHVMRYVNYFIDTFDIKKHSCVAEYVVFVGHVETLKWMIQNNHIFNKDVLVMACKKGNMEIYDLLIKNGCCNLSEKALMGAFENGYLDIAEKMYSSGIYIYDANGKCYIKRNYISESLADVLYKYGNLDGLNLKKIVFKINVDKVFNVIIKRNDLVMIKSFYRNIIDVIFNYVIPNEVMDIAIDNGNVELIKWLHCRSEYKVPERAFTIACEKGDIELVKWTYHLVCDDRENLNKCINIAKKENYYEVVNWLIRMKNKDGLRVFTLCMIFCFSMVNIMMVERILDCDQRIANVTIIGLIIMYMLWALNRCGNYENQKIYELENFIANKINRLTYV